MCSPQPGVLQLKLQHRRTREELVNQGIMPPLKSPAAYHEQRRSLERARTEDYLKRKIRSRPERSELVRMHILEETSVEPSLQAKQLQLKRARLADDLNDKISHRPGPMELIHKNILPVHMHSTLTHTLLDETDCLKGVVESSSPDEDSSDALSPDHLASLDSPPDTHGPGGSNPSPVQSPHLPFFTTSEPSPPLKLTNGMATPVASRSSTGLIKQSQSKSSSDRPSQRSKKPKESKPKVKKLKYHQYIPPDQKAEREPPPQMDDSYARILQQQQLFLQLQILSQQQQQHYNYHTILPAPPKLPGDQQSSSAAAPSQSRSVPTSTLPSSSQNGSNRQSQPSGGGAKPGVLPSNLDDLKVAELKHELKLRSLPVSGTKSDLIERLRSHQEHAHWGPGGGGSVSGGEAIKGSQSQQPGHSSSSALLAGAPPPVTHFGSTSSSPPASPAVSERSLAAMSPDEASCNGDVFGEAVSAPLTQLSLHTSPQHPASVKEEQAVVGACRFSPQAPRPKALDKDRMLQEKDKQIEELTRMLQQKQRLVETLRSQLERGKRQGGEEEPQESSPPPQQRHKEKQDQPLDTGPQQGPKLLASRQQTAPTSAHTLPLDLLKLHPPPTLLTDSNGNHYLIALTSRTVTQSKATGRIAVQRAQSTPGKASSQSPPHSSVQSEEPVRKEQLSEQHLVTVSCPRAPSPCSTPLRPQPLFLSEYSSPSESSAPPSPPQGLVCSNVTQDALLSSPSPAAKLSMLPTPHGRENSSCSQHVDQLFDILVRSGEIQAAFTSAPGAPVSGRVSNSPHPSPPPSPLPLPPLGLHKPDTVQLAPILETQGELLLGDSRLEDFLESTTGKPLLGAEPDGPLTLIDDLHSQMLSTCSILEHPPSPMDTAELNFNPQTAVLDFGEAALDSMDWLDIGMGGCGSSAGVGQVLAPLGSHTPPSVFSSDFLDSSDLHLHWDSCL